MYITTPKRKNGSTVVRLVECFRKEGKIKTRIVKTLGQSKDKQVIEYYKKTARKLLDEHKKGLIKLSDLAWKMPIDLNRFLAKDRYNNGFEDILGSSYRQLGFESLLKRKRSCQILNETLKFCVLVRAFSPSSKLRSCYLLREHFNKDFSHKQVLNMMDSLSIGEDKIRERVFRGVFKEKDSLETLLFDVTTLSFESVSSDDLRDFGYSKDGKFNEVQVVLAVLANEQGLPMAYEVFPGHTGETKTMKAVLSSFVRKYKVRKIRVVADRGMFSDNNFAFFEDMKKKEGIRAEYVVSCPLKKLPKKVKEEIFDFKRNQEEKQKSGSFAYYEFSCKGRRVVVSYSEQLRVRDERKRQRILDKLDSLCKEGKVSAGKLVKNTGVRRYLKTLKGSVEIDKEKIVKDSFWDGLYGVCSNMESKAPKRLLSLYRSLWKIEEVFRINKHTLRMRPIYHRLSRRIRAHILICFLAYTVLRWTEIKLAKGGLFFSSQELIDILRGVESFLIEDKVKRKGKEVYCVPRELSKPARQIYKAFNKQFATKPYRLE